MPNFDFPILYSFRRCPFAMRARFILRETKTFVELREIKLQDKPSKFLETSKKGTVPVLVLPNKIILDESLKIIYWCLKKNNKSSLNPFDDDETKKIAKIINFLDNMFKHNLDRYKYPTRYKISSEKKFRNRNIVFLNKLNTLLKNNCYLFSDSISYIDYIIFPFIRQFRNVDIRWFNSLNFTFLNIWYSKIEESKQFCNIMKKYKIWTNENEPIFTDFNYN